MRKTPSEQNVATSRQRLSSLSNLRQLFNAAFRAFLVAILFQPVSVVTAQFAVNPPQEMLLDTNALVLATSGNFNHLINGISFRQDALISHEGYQYAVWYRNGANQDIFMARRNLNGNTWETIDTGFNMEIGNQDWNSHNVVSIGISSDGRIHMSGDHHVDPLRYMTTNPGVATSAGGPWNSSIFNTERNSLNVGGGSIPRITYPRFTNVGNNFVFTYRDFGSGSGDQRIADYNPQTGQWSSTRVMTKGRGTGQTYNDVINSPSSNRNSYHNGFHADPTGRLHTTWTWRESTQNGNHDIMYAYSDDLGITWRNNAGQLAGTNSSPITLNTPGVEIVDLDRTHAVLNQQGQVVDNQRFVHALMHHRPVGHGFTNSPFSDGSNADYHHYYRDPTTGVWSTNVFPDGIRVGSRPKIGADSRGNVYAVYTQNRDLVVAGSQKVGSQYATWEILYRDNSRDYEGTPHLDTKRLLEDDIISVYIQDRVPNLSVNSPTGSALRVFDFQTVLPPVEPVGDVIAGWDTWDNGQTPVASVTIAGVTGTAVTTSEGPDWNIVDGRGASADGDWGTFEGPPTASTVAGDGVENENIELSNATAGGTITFSITNNSGRDIQLTGFHFDAYAFRPKAARAYELSVISGDITNGSIYVSVDDEITSVGGAWNNNAHDDISHVLTGLPDRTLEAGGSVDFLLSFSSGDGDGSGGHDLWVDNVAITGNLDGLLGDFDNDGDVDLVDLDFYNGNIGEAAVGGLAALDFDADGFVGENDFQLHYGSLVETSNGQKGTLAGDLNLDGTVDVLGDAFALIANLGSSVSSWSQGDLDGNGIVNVLGDAFLLIGNLGMNNN